MSGLVFDVYPLPGVGTWEKKIGGLSAQSASFTDYRRRMGSGLLTIDDDDDLLSDIVYVDPDDHSNDVGSIVRVWRPAAGGYPRTLVGEMVVESSPDELSDGVKTIHGSGNKRLLDFAKVYPWDWDGTTGAEVDSPFPDWVYGGRSVISDPSTATPECEPRISEFWTDATSGQWRITVDGNSVDVAYNVTASALTTAFESLPTVNDVAVEGNGSQETPWRVTFVDPCFPTTYSVSQHTLNDTLQAALIQQGSYQVTGWTEARPLRGNTLYGEYDDFEYATLPAATPAGSTEGIMFDAATPVGFSFPGAQTVPKLTPGALYQGGVWVYVDAAGSYDMRLVLRTETEEPLIADSGWPSTTVTGQTWTLLSFADAQNFDWANRGIFRVSYVGSADPPNIYLADAYLTEGMAEATVGQILLELLDDAQTDHAGTRVALSYVDANFDGTNDSAGQAWPGTVAVSIPRGYSYRQVLDQVFGALGYEWSLTPSSTDGRWDLNVWYQDRGTDYSASKSPALLFGQGTLSGSATSKLPAANAVMVEGAGQRFYIDTDTDSMSSIGRREGYSGDVSFTGDLDGWAGSVLDRFLDASWAPRFEVVDGEGWPPPGVAYGLADTLTIRAGGRDLSRPVEAVGWRYDSVQGVVWSVQFGDATFGGPESGQSAGRVSVSGGGGGGGLAAVGPVAEGVRVLLDRFQRMPNQPGVDALTFAGGGGVPHIVAVSSDEPAEIRAMATHIIPSIDSSAALKAAFDSIPSPGGIAAEWTVWLAGPMDLDTNVEVPSDVKLMGLGAYIDGSGRFELSGYDQLVTGIEFIESGLLLTGAQSLTIRQCLWDGNNTAILVDGTQDDVYIVGNTFYNSGAMIQGVSGGGSLQWSRVYDNVAYSDEGIIDLEAYRIKVHGNHLVMPNGAAVDLASSSGGAHVSIIGNTIDGGWVAVAGVNGTQMGLIIANNDILEPTSNAGIVVDDCDRGNITDNVITHLFPSGTQDGIVVSGTSAGNKIEGNQIIAKAGAFGGTLRYGINTGGSTGGGNRVVGNQLGAAADYGTGPLNLAAGDTNTYPGGAYGDNWA